MSVPLAIRIERVDRLYRLLKTLEAFTYSEVDDLLVGTLRRLHNEVSAWLLELEEPGKAA